MGWSLDYRSPCEPALLDTLFLAAGRALYLACEFESKCQWVLRILAISTHYRATGDSSSTTALAKAMKDPMLGPAIRKLHALSEISSNDLEILERARDARNYIAHDCTQVGPLSSVSAKAIEQKLGQLKVELQALIAGDNLVSTWMFAISEREPAPTGIQTEYPDWAMNWVCEGIDDT